MKSIAIILSIVASFTFLQLVLGPRMEPWMRDDAAYWKKLFCVYAISFSFVATLLVVPMIVTIMFREPTVQFVAWQQPISPSHAAFNGLRMANIIGFVGIGIRIAHDILLFVLQSYLRKENRG